MVGGDSADIARVRPVLAATCRRIVYAGPLGAGMVLKAANNLVTMLQLVAAHESHALVRAAGLDPRLLDEVMTENGNLTDTMRRFLEFRVSGTRLSKAGQCEFDASNDAFPWIGQGPIKIQEDIHTIGP